MFTLFSQEEATAFHEREIREEAKAEGLAEGLAEGKAEGLAEGLTSSVRNLMSSMSLSPEAAMDALGVPADMRDDLAKRLKK